MSCVSFHNGGTFADVRFFALAGSECVFLWAMLLFLGGFFGGAVFLLFLQFRSSSFVSDDRRHEWHVLITDPSPEPEASSYHPRGVARGRVGICWKSIRCCRSALLTKMLLKTEK